mmetsp:Transcript_39486/g.46135  ORF Transcript_39486/g.46135 Transcript_39486/m.46135 type:complete len:83 (+) Transcript_39486:1516-1764(+)
MVTANKVTLTNRTKRNHSPFCPEVNETIPPKTRNGEEMVAFQRDWNWGLGNGPTPPPLYRTILERTESKLGVNGSWRHTHPP